MFAVNAMDDRQRQDFEDYMTAAIYASDRSRRVLLVMITASVLAFAAFWNSRDDSWIRDRIDCVAAAVAVLPEKSSMCALGGSALYGRFQYAQTLRLPVTLDGHISCAERGTSASAGRQEISSRGQACANHYRLHDKQQAEDLLQKLNLLWVHDALMIRVPFFGFMFDVNDLGILSGFTFSIILLWFRFAVSQELHNLRRYFDFASKLKRIEDRKFVFRALAMRQVLTVPPHIHGDAERDAGWSYIITGLFFLPLLVHLVILVHDYETLSVGFAISSANAFTSMCASSAFLMFVAFITIQAIRLNLTINRRWSKEATILRDK